MLKSENDPQTKFVLETLEDTDFALLVAAYHVYAGEMDADDEIVHEEDKGLEEFTDDAAIGIDLVEELTTKPEINIRTKIILGEKDSNGSILTPPLLSIASDVIKAQNNAASTWAEFFLTLAFLASKHSHGPKPKVVFNRSKPKPITLQNIPTPSIFES